jgi:hypothetical protein
MKIETFASIISKMPRPISYAILGFFAIFMPKKLNRNIDAMEEAITERVDEAIRLVIDDENCIKCTLAVEYKDYEKDYEDSKEKALEGVSYLGGETLVLR